MKIKEMIGALQLDKLKGDKAAKTTQLVTKWGEELLENTDMATPNEYPRPQMVRNNYMLLNGIWKYAFTSNDTQPDEWDGDIRVPFSPESFMSGVGRQLKPDGFLWYKRELFIKKIEEGRRLIINFGAVDERCRLYVNRVRIGGHTGGYQAFSMDITEYITEGKNEIQLCVQDKSDTSYHGRGKQMLKNGGMFYTAQSGIWQSVWCEWVPQIYVKRLMITPDFDNDSVNITVIPNKETDKKPISLRAVVYDNKSAVAQGQCEAISGEKVQLDIHINNKKCWTPNSPFLYGLKIAYGEDLIESYFGMRHFSVEKDSGGIPRLCLNHRAYFQNGILDQGYYPESLMTPISDEAMVNDIITAKEKGFNMIRKHCKIEPMRWYYHCDRLGMLVWQDMINGGSSYNLIKTCYVPTVIQSLRMKKDNDYAYMSRGDVKGRLEWKKECIETVRQLYNCTSICTWVLFNEGWGQFDAKKNAEMVKKLDNTRIIDAHSGWFDQNAGDIKSEHIYFFELKVKQSTKPYVLSEYGGISLAVSGHLYSDNHFGYGKHEDASTFTTEYNKIKRRIDELRKEGLSAAVYTQMTDIEEEINGIMTYDRKVVKI